MANAAPATAAPAISATGLTEGFSFFRLSSSLLWELAARPKSREEPRSLAGVPALRPRTRLRPARAAGPKKMIRPARSGLGAARHIRACDAIGVQPADRFARGTLIFVPSKPSGNRRTFTLWTSESDRHHLIPHRERGNRASHGEHCKSSRESNDSPCLQQAGARRSDRPEILQCSNRGGYEIRSCRPSHCATNLNRAARRVEGCTPSPSCARQHRARTIALARLQKTSRRPPTASSGCTKRGRSQTIGQGRESRYSRELFSNVSI